MVEERVFAPCQKNSVGILIVGQATNRRDASVSAMFSQFVQSMANRPKDFKIGPLTRKLTGIAKLPPGKDYKEALTDALCEKYGIDE